MRRLLGFRHCWCGDLGTPGAAIRAVMPMCVRSALSAPN
jgi:hypothetical protein